MSPKKSANFKKSTNLVHIATHPMRYKVLKLLYETNKPMYIAEIARKVGVNKRLVGFHLLTLLQHGLVESEYGLKQSSSKDKRGRPIVVSYYNLSEKGRELMSKLSALSIE